MGYMVLCVWVAQSYFVQEALGPWLGTVCFRWVALASGGASPATFADNLQSSGLVNQEVWLTSRLGQSRVWFTNGLGQPRACLTDRLGEPRFGSLVPVWTLRGNTHAYFSMYFQ